LTYETSRIEAFSDGIFSIAATLLVLELKPPAAVLPFWQGTFQQCCRNLLRRVLCGACAAIQPAAFYVHQLGPG
jgi:uncharacterized membrane protein